MLVPVTVLAVAVAATSSAWVVTVMGGVRVGVGVGVGGAGMEQSVSWKAVHVAEVAVQTREPQHAYGVDEAHARQVPAIMSAGP